MTTTDTFSADASLCVDLRVPEPPLAPLAMPKQVLTRETNSLARAFGAFVSILRRDLGRIG